MGSSPVLRVWDWQKESEAGLPVQHGLAGQYLGLVS